MTEQWIMTVPVVSTVHVKPDTYKSLEFGESAGIQTYSLGDSGLMIFCGEAEDTFPDGSHEDDIENHPDVTEVMRWARKNGSNGWLRLDSSGDVIDTLEKYEWI